MLLKCFLILQMLQKCFLWPKTMENDNLYEGDIVLDPDEKLDIKRRNNFGAIKGGIWPNSIIPYEVYTFTSTSVKRLIDQAIREYENHTCIRFVRKTNEKEYISFSGGISCSSPLGYRKNRVNRVSLPIGCAKIGIVMHEIAHSLGFYHEHSRPDRDQYVDILFENIKEDMASNFKTKSLVIADKLQTPYDYLSIMHYGNKVFSKNGKFTIKTKDKAFQNKIGNREGFSVLDIRKINLRYCQEKPTTIPNITHQPTGCFDKYGTSCASWKDQCSSNEAIRKICCSTCQLKKCGDSSKSCDVWVQSGYCKTNPQLMRSLCQKSCNFCAAK